MKDESVKSEREGSEMEMGGRRRERERGR